MKRRIDTQSAVQSEPCKEALDMINNASFVGGDGLDYVEALVALNALKLVGEPCEDCISRAAVLALPRNTEKTLSGKVMSQSVDVDLIEQLPPVTPKLSKDALDDAYAHGYTEAEAKFYQWREEHECEDAVSRQEVLDLFARNADHTRPYHDTWQDVKNLLPVTPKPKTWSGD